jgi:beta-lactamase class A
MQRRSVFALAPPLLAAPMLAAASPRRAAATEAPQAGGPGGLGAALQRFRSLPGSPSYLLHLGEGGSVARFAHQPGLRLFLASAYKTFVLGQYLREVEAERLALDEELAVDDEVRNIGSPVLFGLGGRLPARMVLEAMLTHSDNMATDIASARAGADRIRALIAEARLRSVQIPDTTRVFESYLFGAPAGTDLGWPGLQRVLADPPPSIRPPLNDEVTLAGTARDLVAWYEQVLRGSFFNQPATLTEFKRIQAMAVQIARVAPPDTMLYAKGGEVGDLYGFNAKSFAGQMVAFGRIPVTFCFLVNWDTADGAFAPVQEAFFDAIADILRGALRSLA